MPVRGTWGWLALLACVLWAGGVWGVQRIALEIGEIRHPVATMGGLQLRFEADGTLLLRARSARFAGREWSAPTLRCASARLDVQGFRCDEGRLELDGKVLPLRFAVEAAFERGDVRVVARLGDGLIEAALDRTGATSVLFSGVELEALLAVAAPFAGALPVQLKGLNPVAKLNGAVAWDPARRRLTLNAQLEEGGFASADGLLAAEALAFAVHLDATEQGSAWSWSVGARWVAGAAYVHPLYLESGPALEARGTLHAGRLRVHEAVLAVDGVERVRAESAFVLDPPGLERLEFSLQGIDLDRAGKRWLAPLLFPAQVDRLRFSGRADVRLEMRAGVVEGLTLQLDEAVLGLRGAAGGEGVGLGPLVGGGSWSRTQPTEMRVAVGGGYWEKLALGAFSIEAHLAPEHASFARMEIPLLDGALVIDEFGLKRGPGHWEGRASVVIEPVSMRALTAALDLPEMSGVLSASLPGVRANPGEIALDGALVVSVFDGYLQATGLRLLEPFGVASHLSADIEARHLDLHQLTETFSFGNITGFVDADVRGLELARWRPVAFDARIASSPGEYRRRISQRAVENISALGGAGALAALQRGLIGFFDSFGYRELGLRCVLRDGVCAMDGVEGVQRSDGGFVIVRGGGVPALDVIGYNRRVDWNELVDRLQRVIDENVSPELH